MRFSVRSSHRGSPRPEVGRRRTATVLLGLVFAATLLSACAPSHTTSAAARAVGLKKLELARGFGDGPAQGVGVAFSPVDTEIYAVITFSAPMEGARVTALWTLVESADGRQKDMDLGRQERSGITGDTAAVYAGPFPSSAGTWPPGRYAVDLLVNERLERTAEFIVR
jgi:hypothetical protein